MAYDAVIIGAGHNGLAAGVHLAAKGKRVAIVEAKDEPGGAVKTRDLTLPGFRHDLCAMNLSMFAGSGFFAAHKDALAGARPCLRSGGACLRDRISRRDVSRRQPHAGDNARGHFRPLAGGREGLG